MKALFGVQTVFIPASKHYKSAGNSFSKRVLVIPKRDRDVFIQEVCVTPKRYKLKTSNMFAFSFQNVMKT